jgi:hypothetical protein
MFYKVAPLKFRFLFVVLHVGPVIHQEDLGGHLE